LLVNFKISKIFLPFSKSFIFLLFAFFFISQNVALHAMETPEERAQYTRGIQLRNEGKFAQAKDCFLPLARKEIVEDNRGFVLKAQHNLAMCFHRMKNQEEAYVWCRKAAKRGFEPSQNNLKSMNALYGILTDDNCLLAVASFLNLKDFIAFGGASQRPSQLLEERLTRTDFLTSRDGFAVDFRRVFKDMLLTPKPRQIRVQHLVNVENGSAVVRFLNPQDLRKTVERTPLIHANKVYFVHDSQFRRGEEVLPIGGRLQRKYFLHVVDDKPIRVSGKATLPLHIVLPPQSDYDGLKVVQGGLSCSKVQTYESAYSLAKLIETFDERLYRIRTADAHQLLEDRAQDRRKSPQSFPKMQVLCPQSLLIADPAPRIEQRDYISAKQPLVYIASAIAGLDALQVRLPDFSSAICFIDPSREQAGIYCVGPLLLKKGFEVFADGDLTITGTMHLHDHNLKLTSTGNVAIVAASLKADSIALKAENAYVGGARLELERIPETHRDRFLTHLRQRR